LLSFARFAFRQDRNTPLSEPGLIVLQKRRTSGRQAACSFVVPWPAVAPPPPPGRNGFPAAEAGAIKAGEDAAIRTASSVALPIVNCFS
jgi:hypothetical protein